MKKNVRAGVDPKNKLTMMKKNNNFGDSVKSLFATSAAHFVNDGALAVFPIMYAYFVKNNDLSTLSIGVLAFLLYLVSMIASPSIGKLSDSSRKFSTLLATGLFFLAIGIFGYSAPASFFSGTTLVAVLVPFTIFAGVGSAYYHPLGATVIREMWKSGNHGRAMGINGSFGSLGRALYPLFTTGILVVLGVPEVAVLAVASAAIGFLVIFVLKSVQFTNKSVSPAAPKATSEASLPTSKVARLMMSLMIVSFSRGLYTLGTLSFIPIYLNKVDHFSLTVSGVIYSILLATGIIGQPLFGSLADRFGRRLILEISNVGSFIFLLLFVETQNSILGPVYLSLFGLFGLTSFPLLLGIVASNAPKGSRTVASSLVWGIGNTAGIAAAPLLIGVLTEAYLLGSLQGAFLVVTLIGLLAIFLTPLVRKSAPAETVVRAPSS